MESHSISEEGESVLRYPIAAGTGHVFDLAQKFDETKKEQSHLTGIAGGEKNHPPC